MDRNMVKNAKKQTSVSEEFVDKNGMTLKSFDYENNHSPIS